MREPIMRRHLLALLLNERGGIQVPPDSTGKIVETVVLTDHRQIVVVGGAAAVAEQGEVKNAALDTPGYGLTVRPVPRRFGAVLTTTALGISGAFTQAWQDGNADGVLFVEAAARADVASATNGFTIEETDDDADANFTRVVAQKTVSATTTTFLYAIIRGRKWRVTYTNGGTAQTTFKLTAAESAHQTAEVDVEGRLIVGLLDAAGARISPATSGQLPSALVGGRLDVNLGASGITLTTDPSDRVARALGRAFLRNPGDTANMGDATTPVRTDPTGTTTQPVSDAAGSLTVDAPVGTPVAVRLSDGAAFIDPRDVTDRIARLLGQVDGRAAHDAPVAGNPHLIAARANLNEPAVVADGDVTHLWADQLGRLVVVAGHPNPEPPVTVNGSAAGVSVIAAPGAGVSLYIHRALITNRAAAENVVSLREGSAGTIRFTGNFAADGGGAIADFGSRGWKLPANTALVADIGAASADVNVLEYSIAA